MNALIKKIFVFRYLLNIKQFIIVNNNIINGLISFC